MATEAVMNGEEIKPGDEVIVRAKVIEVFSIGGDTLLRVEWKTSANLIDFVKASQVEKI